MTNQQPGTPTPRAHRPLQSRTQQGGHVARRDFLRMLVVVSGGLVVSTGAVVTGAFRRKTPAPPAAKRIANAIAPGESIAFSYPGEDNPAIAVGMADGTLAACSSVCTHLGCAVLWQKDSQRLVCPCHEGMFDPTTGQVLAGPPPRPLPRITLERHPDGVYAVKRSE